MTDKNDFVTGCAVVIMLGAFFLIGMNVENMRVSNKIDNFNMRVCNEFSDKAGDMIMTPYSHDDEKLSREYYESVGRCFAMHDLQDYLHNRPERD